MTIVGSTTGRNQATQADLTISLSLRSRSGESVSSYCCWQVVTFAPEETKSVPVDTPETDDQSSAFNTPVVIGVYDLETQQAEGFESINANLARHDQEKAQYKVGWYAGLLTLVVLVPLAMLPLLGLGIVRLPPTVLVGLLAEQTLLLFWFVAALLKIPGCDKILRIFRDLRPEKPP